MQYIFLDESGQFYKSKHESFFVIGSFITANPRRLAKKFRAWQQSKFPKKFKFQSEIKFSDNGISTQLKLKTLAYIASLDVRIRYSFLHTNSIPIEYRKAGRIMTGKLYTDVVGETLASYFPHTDTQFQILCDHHHIKGYRKSEYIKLLKSRLAPLIDLNSDLSIEMVDSTSNSNIQISDWIASSLAACLNQKTMGQEYYSILRNNIIGRGIEFFANNSVSVK